MQPGSGAARSAPTEAGSGQADSGRAPRSTGDDALDADVARLLLAGYPDRVARRRSSQRRDDHGRDVTVFHLRSGGEVALPKGPDAHHLSDAEWIVVADLDGGDAGRSGRLHLGAAIDAPVVLEALDDAVRTEDVVEWDPARDDLTAVRRRTLGAITVAEERLRDPDRAAMSTAVLRAVAADLSVLPGLAGVSELRARVAFLPLRHTATCGPTGPMRHWRAPSRSGSARSSVVFAAGPTSRGSTCDRHW